MATMMSDIEAWDVLKRSLAWTSLRKSFPFAGHVDDALFIVSEHVFVVAQSYDRNFCEGGEDAPYLTTGYWASNRTAAIRGVLQMNVVVDTVDVIWPAHISLTPLTYRNVANMARSPLVERAEYSSGGDFLHKVVTYSGMDLCYLSQGQNLDENPYLVRMELCD